MGKAVLFLLALVGGVVVVSWVAHALFGAFFYLVLTAAVVGGGLWLYGRIKREIAPGTRTQRRIEAATKTYRMRNR
ncbi:hypothetical protein Acy02nite_54690 [Actinoplanes cyaneus]|jgi:hypothetical protein|uniref:Uncharacterized protein n=1 Tax=Actinoplanes cyaneus TaxID=52696 RepID=A0A919IQA5_9ACTN|nr:hypothetical protein [Actinoplanes cyaneus]MCW2140453.1 hypothetical protein [Actinoplanes cyaneus]GID67588.1 hypothetical protein Acy02nite_54690 [Actinoplanes cyaneus]